MCCDGAAGSGTKLSPRSTSSSGWRHVGGDSGARRSGPAQPQRRCILAGESARGDAARCLPERLAVAAGVPPARRLHLHASGTSGPGGEPDRGGGPHAPGQCRGRHALGAADIGRGEARARRQRRPGSAAAAPAARNLPEARGIRQPADGRRRRPAGDGELDHKVLEARGHRTALHPARAAEGCRQGTAARRAPHADDHGRRARPVRAHTSSQPSIDSHSSAFVDAGRRGFCWRWRISCCTRRQTAPTWRARRA